MLHKEIQLFATLSAEQISGFQLVQICYCNASVDTKEDL